MPNAGPEGPLGSVIFQLELEWGGEKVREGGEGRVRTRMGERDRGREGGREGGGQRTRGREEGRKGKEKKRERRGE